MTETKKEVKTLNVYQKLQAARVELQKLNIKKSEIEKIPIRHLSGKKKTEQPLNAIRQYGHQQRVSRQCFTKTMYCLAED